VLSRSLRAWGFYFRRSKLVLTFIYNAYLEVFDAVQLRCVLLNSLTQQHAVEDQHHSKVFRHCFWPATVPMEVWLANRPKTIQVNIFSNTDTNQPHLLMANSTPVRTLVATGFVRICNLCTSLPEGAVFLVSSFVRLFLLACQWSVSDSCCLLLRLLSVCMVGNESITQAAASPAM